GREVGGEVFALGGGGNHGDALLQQPGEGDLCRAGVVAFADALQYFVLHYLAVGERHVGGDVDALAAGEVDHLAVLQEGVHLDLVGGDVLGTDGVDGLLHVSDGEVGNADGAGQAAGLGFHHLRQVVGDGQLVVGRWPVHQGEVHLLHAQL